MPLWTEIGDLMPAHPQSKAAAAPVALGRPAPAGRARPASSCRSAGAASAARSRWPTRRSAGARSSRPTLWAAIQYLMPGEDAPEHRHTQHAFRFVVEGEGVWTVVGRDPVPMRRGDFLPQAGWNWHAHHNATDEPDGVDRRPGHPVPVRDRGAVLRVRPRRDHRRGAGHARPLPVRAAVGSPRPDARSASRPAAPGTPLLAYRWEHTDRALTDQLAARGRRATPAIVEPGHAAVRYTNPRTGARRAADDPRRDAPHRAAAPRPRPVREVGSSVYQVFDGSGTVTVGDRGVDRRRAATCSSCRRWQPFTVRSEAGSTDSDSGALDLFRFSDTPIFEALQLHRSSADPPATPDRDPCMKLATARTRGLHPRRPRRRGHPRRPRRTRTSASSSPSRDWKERARLRHRCDLSGRRAWSSRRSCRGRPRWCASGSTTATTSPRWAATCPSTRRCSRSSPTP